MQPEKTGNSAPAASVNSLWEGPPSEDGATGKAADSGSQLSDEES